MARSKKRESNVVSVARRKKRVSNAARRRAGDAAELAQFRNGVRLRAVQIPDKKREAARRACRAKNKLD